MYIKKLTIDDQSNYTALAELNGDIFNSPSWHTVFDSNFMLYGIFDNNHKLIGGFHIYFSRFLKLFNLIIDPPFTPSIGLFYINPSINPAQVLSNNKEVLTLLCDFLKQQKRSVVRITLPKIWIDTQPFYWERFKVVPQYTYVIDLLQPVDEIMKNMSSKLRNNINKARKDGITVEPTNDYSLIKSFVCDTFNRAGRRINIDILDKILFSFASATNSMAFVAIQNNEKIASVFCLYGRDTMYYILAGYKADRKHEGAGALCLINAILAAKKAGLKKFDFEGSMIPAIEKYFRSFGGQLTPYFTINKAPLLFEIALKFFKRSIF